MESKTKLRKSSARVMRERIRMAAAQAIKSARDESGMEQWQLGEKIGLSKDTQNDLENGKRKVEVGDVVLVARALGIAPEVLIRRILNW